MRKKLPVPFLSLLLLAFFGWLGISAPVGDEAPSLPFEVVPDWPELPQGWHLGNTMSVAVDSHNNVYVLNKGKHPVIGFSSEGKLLRSWGEGLIVAPHGLEVDAEDNVWVTDIENHIVVKFSSQGRVLMVLGRIGTPAEDEWSFDKPTDVAFGPGGEVYVTDGYGNSRIVKFSKEGDYSLAWGKKGDGPGEFSSPHTLFVDSQGRVFVGDRENHRIQIFDANGRFLDQWNQVGTPFGLAQSASGDIYMVDGYANHLLKLDQQGRILGRLGKPGRAPGRFRIAHHLTVGQNGELYVAEVENLRVQKFVPR